MESWWEKSGVSLKLEPKTFETLKSYSEEQGLSLETLINNILHDYVAWSLSASEAGWVPMQRPLLIALANAIDDETICKIASGMAKTTAKDFLLYMHGEYSAKELIEFLKARAKVAGFPYKLLKQNGHTKFIMQHDMGMKWSLIFKSFYEKVLEDLTCDVTFDLTDNTFVFKINDQCVKP